MPTYENPSDIPLDRQFLLNLLLGSPDQAYKGTLGQKKCNGTTKHKFLKFINLTSLII